MDINDAKHPNYFYVKDDEYTNLLHVTRKNKCNLKATVTELNKIHHYKFNNIDAFLEYFNYIRQFVSASHLKLCKIEYESELKRLNEAYSYEGWKDSE